jgi:serine/threonine protein kinase
VLGACEALRASSVSDSLFTYAATKGVAPGVVDGDVLLGELFVRSGLLSRDAVQRALVEVGRHRAAGRTQDLAGYLVAQGLVAREAAERLKRENARPSQRLGPAAASIPPTGLGRTWGRYEILGEVARGAMGAVYRARDTRRGGQEVALKVLLQGSRAEGEDLERFKREARSLARLAHPSIVRVYDYGVHEGCPFLTMDFVAGTTLESILKDGGLPIERGLVILEEVARAVDHAHSRGVVHRDLKPSNVLIGADGRARITDFGLAKILDEGHNLTRTGDLIGTPLYMSPEQIRGDLAALGASADVWSLGVTLYTLLVGVQPFGAKTVEAVARRVLDEEPVPPEKLKPEIAKDLSRICVTALAKDPNRRYQSAGEFASDLRLYLHGKPVLAGRVTPLLRLRRWGRALRLLRFGSGAALALAVLGGI